MVESGADGTISALRGRIARLERRASPGGAGAVIRFGVPVIDAGLPARGLLLGALHELAGAGPDTEHAATAALLAAGLLARTAGPVVWVAPHPDLFAPALAGAGLDPGRVVFVAAGRGVLAAMEDALRHPGLAGVVGELPGRLKLTASRRLQLAAESGGGIGFAIRRSPRFDDPVLAEPSAAVTRWRVAALPSPPALPHATDVPGLGRARWRLDLTRCRGGVPHSWTVEACDAQGRLDLVAELAHRPAAPARLLRAAG